jgi:glycosyltransferase involved in cell wall biosynthesis
MAEINESPLVSVVIPTYKLADFLPATLESVRVQTLPRFEVIVVDDGSPDDVVGAAKPFTSTDTRFRYVRQQNRGLPGARNFGYGHCDPRSSYVMFLDADDLLLPTALAEMSDHLHANSAAGMVCCRPRRIDDAGGTLHLGTWPRGIAYGPRCLTEKDRVIPFEAIYTLTAGIICSLTLIRRRTYDSTTGFDSDFGHNREDSDLFLAIALRSEVHRLERELVCYRKRGGQMSEDSALLDSQRIRLYEVWRNKPDLTPDQRQIVAKAESFRTSPSLLFASCINSARELWRNGQRGIAIRVVLGAVKQRLLNHRRQRTGDSFQSPAGDVVA